MKRVKQSVAGLLMVLGLTAVLPSVADEVVATAAGGWFAVDSRAVKDTTLQGGVIIGGATNVVLQSSPDAWGETGGGTSATISYVSAAGSGTVAAATTAREVEWTPAAHSGTNTLTYLSGTVEKTAQFFALTPVAVTIPSVTHATVTNITVNGEVVAVATPVTVPEHATVVVFYKADTGYHLSGETTATLADITDEHKTIDVSAVTVAKGELCSTWAQVKAALESGYSVKLTQDMDAAFGIGYPSGYDLTIDMNGKTVTRTVSDRLFGYGNAKIRVTDSVGGGCFTAGTSTLPYRGSFALLINNATFVLDGDVTIEGFKAGGSSTEGTGGAFAVDSGASLIISNGVIRGCSANTNGGAVYLKSGASFTMAGGEIIDCTAASLGGALYSNGAVVLTNGVMALNHANGGAAICFEGANGTVSITDMTFTNNVVSGYGGAINFGNSGGSYVMRNCLVKGNSATATGGAISVGAGAQVDIYDCTMTDNKSTNGGAVHLNTGANNRIRIYGIVLAGNTKGAAISDFNLEKSGAVTAYGGVYGTNPSGVTNLTIADGFSSTKVGSYWVIGQNVLGGCGKIVNGTLTFCPTNAEYVAAGVAPDSTKVTTSGSGTSYAVAPKDGIIEANAWAEVKSALEAGKSVKLMANVAQSAAGSQVTLTTAGLNVFLDLNGYVVTCYSSNCRFVEVNVTSGAGATFTLKDSVGTGVVKDGSWTNGGCVWLAPGNFFVMEGGRIYNCSGNSTGNSGAVYVNGATFTMNGGTIDSCKNLNTGSGGGAVYVTANGTFVMNDGMITNCTATSGGAVYNIGTTIISNGTITACSASWATGDYAKGGGAIYNSGTLTVEDGIMSSNKALSKAEGAVFYTAAGGTITVNGGLFENNVAEHLGGFCYAPNWGGALIINGGEITANTSVRETLDGGIALTITGGSIHDNVCTTLDYVIYLVAPSADPTITGGYIAGNVTGVSDGRISGGVFDRALTAAFVASGKTCTQVGTNYVVGTGIASDANNKLTAGTYTFNPTNAEYVAAGVEVKEGKFINAAMTATPKTWTISDYETKADPSSTYKPTQIVNGGFDQAPWMDYVLNGTYYDGTVKSMGKETGTATSTFPNGVDKGWNTSTMIVQCNALFDYQNDTMAEGYFKESATSRWIYNWPPYSMNPSITKAIYAAHGGFIECNACEASTLYQDLTTYGGDVIRWSFGHAVRTDQWADQVQPMTVYVGAPNGTPSNTDPAIVAATQGKYYSTNGSDGHAEGDGRAYGNVNELKNLRLNKTDHATDFYTAAGVYVVPAQQSVTRFAFQSNSTTNPGGGNWMDDVTFSTLIGNLKARVNDDGTVTITGYWGDSNSSKKLMVKIGSGAADAIDMSGVLNTNFTITVTSEKIGLANSLEVYHQDYESAKRTVKIGWAVTLNLNAADATCAKLTEYQRGAVTVLPIPTRPSYRFEGWFTNSVMTGDAVTSIPADATGPKEFWAKWHPVVSVAIPSVSHATVASITVDGKSVAVTTPVLVPSNGTIVVSYRADAGYYLSEETTATLKNVTEDNKTIDVSKVKVMEGVLCSTWAQMKAALEGGQNVRLTASFYFESTDATCYVSGSRTLDMNGHTITATSSVLQFFRMYYGDLRIIGTGAFDGNYNTCNNQGHFAYVDPGRSLTIDGNVEIRKMRASSEGGAVYVQYAGTLTMNAGKITDCASSSNGGAFFINSYYGTQNGVVTIYGGEISNCYAQGSGGAICNNALLYIYGGRFINNSASSWGGFCYCLENYGQATYIYGGVFAGNTSYIAQTPCPQLYVGGSWQHNGYLYGGVFDADPTSYSQSNGTLECRDSYTVSLVGSQYVVGKSVATDAKNKLTAGTYTFSPTNAEYVAAVAVAPSSTLSKNTAVWPTTWTLTDRRISVTIPSVTHTTVTNITVNGESVAVTTSILVPSNSTIVVWYKPNEGYVLTGDPSATLENVTPDHKTIDVSEVTTKWHHTHCICGDGECEVGGHVHADLEWQKWTGTTSLPTSAGNWYLANDVTLSSTYAPPTGVNLCLNGKVVKQGGSCNKLVNISGGIFTLTDCTDTPHYFNKVNAGYRSDVWVYSLTTSPSASSICVKGGCITGGYGWSGSPSHSPCLNVVSGSTFNFYRGNLIGNCAEQTAAGMRVYDGATLNMYGGTVEGNYSSWGFCNLEGTANIYGGSFRNNGNCSGGLACSGVTTIYDVEVSGNVSYGGAAGLYANGTFMMLGGKVFGNRTTANNGGFEIAATATATIGGNVCVTGNYCNASRSGFEYSGGAVNNLYLPADKTVLISTATPLAHGAQIGVTTATKPTSGNPIAVTGVNAADYSDFFFSDSDDYYIYNSANTVVLGKTGNPVVKDKEGNDVTIEIPDDWRKAHKVTSEEVMKPEKKLKNGHPAWQNYVLGIDPTNELSGVYADAPQNTAADKVTVKTKNVVKVADGYSVQYRLDTKLGGAAEYTKGTPQASADIDVALDGSDPTGLYKLNVVISKGGTEIDQSAEALNVVGLVKATNTNRFSVVAVPWNRLAPGEEAEIAVSNVIKTATLEAGDKLHVFNRLAKTYDTWTLNEQKEWDSVVTYAIAADGTLSASVSGASATETIARGSGIWLERMNPTNAPYFLYGQASSNAVEYVIEEGHNLIGAPGVEAFDFSRVKGAAEGDQILVPGVVPKLYTIKDGVWGYFKTVAKTINVKGTLKTTFKAVWTTTENTAPAGTGFWLINKSGNAITIE